MKKVKIFLAALAVFTAAIIALSIAVQAKNSLKPLEKAGLTLEDVTLISHRGLAALAPENTLEAAEKAAEAGYTEIEFDIRQTADGIWVLHHDSDIKRMTGGKGEISSLTFKQLFDYPIKGSSTIIPTLDEMLTVCAESGLNPVIEIKQSGTDNLASLISQISMSSIEKMSIITFSREQAEYIYSYLESGQSILYLNSVEVWWLTDELDEETLETAKQNPSIGVSFNGNNAGKPEEIEAFKQAGIELAAWTIDSPKRMKELYDLGIKIFTSDLIVPELIAEGSQEASTEEQ